MNLLQPSQYAVCYLFPQVIRYASTATVVPLGEDEDPCREVACDVNSYCRLGQDGQTARCVCNPGQSRAYVLPVVSVVYLDIVLVYT